MQLNDRDAGTGARVLQDCHFVLKSVACPRCYSIRKRPHIIGRSAMKWAGMYLVCFTVLVRGLLAALWKLGVLQRIGVALTLIGVAVVIGFGIMISVANSGRKENIEIDRK